MFNFKKPRVLTFVIMLKYLHTAVLEVVGLMMDEYRCDTHFSNEEKLGIASWATTWRIARICQWNHASLIAWITVRCRKMFVIQCRDRVGEFKQIFNAVLKSSLYFSSRQVQLDSKWRTILHKDLTETRTSLRLLSHFLTSSLPLSSARARRAKPSRFTKSKLAEM